MASSAALQMDKFSWPSQILLVYRLGKASTTPETPTPNHNPSGSRYTVEHASQHRVASLQLASSRALGIKQLGRQEGVFLDLGKWICIRVLEWTPSKRLGLAYSKIDLSLLQHQSASQEKHGRLHIFQHQSTGYLRTRGQEALYAACAFSVTSEESLRDSEPPLMDTRAPRDRRFREV